MDDFIQKLRALWDKKWIRVSCYTLFGLVVFALLMDNLVMPLYTKHGQAIPVPEVTGLLYEDAKARIDSQGFQIIRSEERHDAQYPSGYVIEQIPRPGSLVKSGRRIYVIISRGERKFEVPELVDISERDAHLKLAKYGLVLGERRYEPSGYYPKGVVMHQSIASGVEVPSGTRIDITVSIGPAMEEVEVPLVEGRTLDDAKELLAREGLQIGEIMYRENDQLLPDTVLKQSISAGTRISRSEKIDLVVSTLPGRSALRN